MHKQHVSRMTVVLYLLIGVVLLSMNSGSPHVHAASLSVAPCPDHACHIYLPISAAPPITPQLITPANGASITSLAPELTWLAPISGTYQIELSLTPAFATTVFSTTDRVGSQAPIERQHPPNSNLTPQTQYYWHVGISQGTAYAYSQTQSFTTPQENKNLLPPKPTLVAPPNQSVVLSNTVTLSWQAVSGALNYRAVVRNPDGSQFASTLLDGSTTSYEVTDLNAATSYTWQVKVLNAYGWSSYADPFTFTVP